MNDDTIVKDLINKAVELFRKELNKDEAEHKIITVSPAVTTI